MTLCRPTSDTVLHDDSTVRSACALLYKVLLVIPRVHIPQYCVELHSIPLLLLPGPFILDIILFRLATSFSVLVVTFVMYGLKHPACSIMTSRYSNVLTGFSLTPANKKAICFLLLLSCIIMASDLSGVTARPYSLIQGLIRSKHNNIIYYGTFLLEPHHQYQIIRITYANSVCRKFQENYQIIGNTENR